MSKNPIDYITNAPGAPEAIGPYSQATVAGNLVFLSGQIPLDPKTKQIVEGGIEKQAEQVMSNLKAVLEHIGIGFGNVVKTTILLQDLAHFQTVNAIYEKWLGGVKPARATFQVAGLPRGSLIEIEMTAVK